MVNNNEIWVFLSHSNKDYEKVRQVRNMLEEHSLRPLMFFLHCLNDDDEIDSLIKREIDCRTRFILCDSENARKSHWVQKEVEYIKSQNRICETIDLSKSMNEIMSILQDFINKSRIFISYNREEFELAEMVYNRLSLLDFAVYVDRAWDFNSTYHQNYKDALDYLENSVVKANGYVIAIMNERILNPNSASRYELLKAMHDNKSIGKETPNIIPFATRDTVVGLIKGDKELASLLMCNIQSIEGLNIDRQCDEIVKRVVTQLMTPGSIKALADNLCKGTFGASNLKEADFLYGLLDNAQKEFALTSESGTFYVNDGGIVLRFEPSEGNPIKEEKVDEPQAYYGFVVKKSIKHLIVPEGVKGFVSDFMRGIRVLERFSLPDGLLSIGNDTYEVVTNDAQCVFADCILPTVVVPESVKELGSFAFGHTHIECLQLSESLHSPYGRQFKDSFIDTLRLPEKWKDGVSLDKYGRLHLTGWWFNDDQYGYLRWPSTHVEKLEFY